MRRYILNFFSTDWGINNGKNNGSGYFFEKVYVKGARQCD